MTGVITSISKYVLSLLMLLYMAGSFLMLRKAENEKRQNALFVLQVLLVLLFHAVSEAVILLHVKELRYFLLYLLELLFLILYTIIFRSAYKKSSALIFSHMLMFLAIGFVMLQRLNFDRALKQLLFAAAAALLTLVLPHLFRKMRNAISLAVISGVSGLLLLSAVLVFSGKTYGANLSLSLGPFTFQPSEFVKISFVLLTAFMFRERHDYKRVLLSGVFALAHVLILAASTDLGGAMIFAFSYLFTVYAATKSKGYLITGLLIGIPSAAAAWFLFPHVRTRVQIFLDPWPMFYDKGNQVCNSLLGIADGGLLGTGLFGGRPDLIPVVEKDFIFSAVSEELGGIAAISLILMCLSCTIAFLKVSMELYLTFYRLSGIGLAVIYGIQCILSVGGNIKFIPATGVTLPLVSYGGSSIFSTFILFSLMQELFIKRKQEEAEEPEEGGGHG